MSDHCGSGTERCYVAGCSEEFESIEAIEDHIIAEAEKEKEWTPHAITRAFFPVEGGTGGEGA